MPLTKQRTSSRGERSRGRPGGRVPVLRLLALLGAVLAGTAGFGRRYIGVLAAVAPGSVVRNGGMEEPYIDGIALPWLNNSWGDAAVSFSQDRSAPHSGNAAQHIH